MKIKLRSIIVIMIKILLICYYMSYVIFVTNKKTTSSKFILYLSNYSNYNNNKTNFGYINTFILIEMTNII